ncbi:uncharacterized protein LOC117566472 [Drosophila albomicans]|uniref:Uncharacterized protein LOC117566472 n=1 Tax=Drosophila albomicans TaxID=7291 RepID=A0A6P8WEC4_DROAB|nr:uncharacterized protein LOC117566472 [Drosophila albomicans]
MASKIVMFLLLLGLTLREGDSRKTCSFGGTIHGRIHNFPPNEFECVSNSTVGYIHNLIVVVRVMVDDDVDRYHIVVNMARKVPSMKMEFAIYEALCMVAKKSTIDPVKIMDFYKQMRDSYNMWPVMFYRVFVQHSAKALSLAVTNQPTEFSVNGLLQGLTKTERHYMEKILNVVFDTVLSSESPLNMVQRLSYFGASLEQLTMAHLQLLNRPEVQSNSTARAELLDNFRQVMTDPKFERNVEKHLRQKVRKLFPHYLDWISTGFINLRRANIDTEEYLIGCQKQNGRMSICTSPDSPYRDSIVYYTIAEYHNKTLVGIGNYCGTLNNNIPTITINPRSFFTSCWWRVVLVPNGIALYDDATSSVVLCGGDSAQWDGDKHYAYARRAEDFETHRDECTWFFENDLIMD